MKTIDVMEGDQFGADEFLCQIRGDMFRNFEPRGVTGWVKATRYAENATLRPVSHEDASVILRLAGYTLTPAAKPEAKPADVPTCAVHLHSDAHLSAVIGRVNGIADWMYTLESRLAAVTESAADARQIADNVSDRVDELLERVHGLEKPADKDAARVVLPKCPEHVTREYRLGWNKAIEMAKEALASQGITVEAAE